MKKYTLLCVLVVGYVLLLSSCSSSYYDKDINATVRSNTQPPYSNGAGYSINLHRNVKATNPTWDSLKSFIRNDDIFSHALKIDLTLTPTCGDVAQTIYNDAESAGIKAAFVVVHFNNGSVPYALNLFNTSDKGLIFIDCTEEDFTHMTPVPFGKKAYGVPDNDNKVAYVQVGKLLGFISMDFADNFGFSYTGYQEWQKQYFQFHDDLQAYNDEVSKYGSDTIESVPPDVYTDLQAKENTLDKEAQPLGAFWEPLSLETVKTIDVYW